MFYERTTAAAGWPSQPNLLFPKPLSRPEAESTARAVRLESNTGFNKDMVVVQGVGLYQSGEVKQSRSGVMSKQGVVISWSESEAQGVSVKASLAQESGAGGVEAGSRSQAGTRN